ncbi:autotransporter domain-containing protein [Achromobacter marplatensis]|uniref:autotransporter domain-containing protein n=1 Tax=Achromobacter marplatensis TaxID=470868 RepID=UPI0039F6F3D6
MNHIYRLVWNRSLCVWQAASELASQSRGGQSPAGGCVTGRRPRYATQLALTIGLSALSAAVQAACTELGTSVVCIGEADPAAPSFSSGANGLIVDVAPDASLGVLLNNGGAAMALTGDNVALTNAGRIDSNLLGRPTLPSAGLTVGNGAASIQRIVNTSSGTIAGTAGGYVALPDLNGMAMAVQNVSGGVSYLSNAGMIRSAPISSLQIDGPDLPVVAAFGGGRVEFVNQGTITGRVAFEAPALVQTGNRFTNAGLIVGSVSLGQGRENTFTAVTGGTVIAGQHSATADLTVTGMAGLRFAPPGKIDGGAGGNNTLVLQNVLPAGTGSGTNGTGSASGDTYINFQQLQINSGTWTLTDAPLTDGGAISLNGGLANLMNGAVLGTGSITARGGSLSAADDGLTVANHIELVPIDAATGGLLATGARPFTLSGDLSGTGGLAVASGSTLTLRGMNAYVGGTTVNAGATLHGDAASLQGDIANNGTLAFAQDTSGTYAGVLSGTGVLSKSGVGTLMLAGANTHTGETRVTAGTLAIRAGGSLASSITNLASGTTLDLSAAGNQTLPALLGAGNVILGANTLTLNSSTSNTFQGVISGTGGLVKAGTGTQTLTGANPFEGGLTINGGTLALGLGASLSANAPITVNAGGALNLSASVNHAFQTLNGNGGEVTLGATTLTLQTGAYAGRIAGTGGLDKYGMGTLALNGVNSYTGNTQVMGGLLQIGADASHATARVNGDITVNNQATLGGFGQVNGDVTVTAGGRLAPGTPGGVFTVNGDLTLGASSLVDFSLGASGASHSVTVNGDLRLNGSQLNIQNAGGFGIGVYRLFDYTGLLSTSGAGLAGPADMSIQYLAGSINLVNTAGAELNFWNANGLASPSQMGGGSGIWSLTGANWTNDVGAVTAPRQPADAFAIFGGAAGTVTVNATPGAVSAVGIQFASDGYRLDGDALTLGGLPSTPLGEVRVGDGSPASASWTATIDNVLTGNGINKTGLGTLVLNGANAYTLATRLTLGTLSVSTDGNLGASTAGLEFQGGTLRVTGTGFQSTGRGMTLGAAGGGLDIADAGNTFTVAQALSGEGGLAKLGAGTLVLTGDNTYLGGTSVRAGTLQVGNGAGSGSIAGNADLSAGAVLAFKRADRVVFAGNLSGAGELRQAGMGTLVLTGQNTHTGVTTIDSGTLQVGDGGAAGSILGDIVNQGSLIFNRSDDSTYAGALSGAGATTKLGAGALLMTGDSSAYTGTTQLAAGTLQVDGKLGGQLQAAAGTTLTGIGTLNSVTIGSGAALSPGNAAQPFGQMQLRGDLTFQPGATYRVASTAGGQNSGVHVAGTATLSGSVVQMARNGNYAPSTTYTILSADNGVLGRFDAVSSNLAFLTPSLSYGSHRVDLTVNLKEVPDDGGTRPIQFADAADTGNQRAVAGALQSLPTNSALYQHVLNLPDGAPPAAYNALSGEPHASAISALQGLTSTFSQAPITRLRANLDAGWLPGAPTAQLGLGDAAALPRTAAQPLWTQVSGNWTTLGGDGNTAKTTLSDAGITIGGDHAVGAGWRLGGALGYNDGRSRTADRASSTEVDSYSIAVYGGKAFDAGAGKVNLTLGAAYTWSDLDTQRNTAAAGLDQTLKASYSASTSQFFTELGYAAAVNDHLTLEPFVAANYSDMRTRGFSESGGDAALRGQSSRNDVTTTTLGLHALTRFDSAGARGYARGTLGWRHAFGDVNPASALAFVQGGDSFTVTGAPVARDAAVVELAVGIEVSKRTTVGVAYGGQFGDGNRQNTGTLDVRYRF